MSIIRQIAGNVLKMLPNEGKYIKTSIRKLLVRKDLILMSLSQRNDAKHSPDPRTVYWIDPMRIESHTALKTDSSDWEDWVFPQKGRLKIVQDGNWDRSDFKVADMRICRAVEDRIHRGMAWTATNYYQTAVRQIESGRRVWGCVDRAAFDRRCAEIDTLIDSMIKAGYRESSQPGNGNPIDSTLGHQEILVNISRDGQALFQDGRHRLAIARALRMEKIPVQILVRHAEWQVFRRFLQQIARDQRGGAKKKGALYQKPLHFDLIDIPFEHGCEDRWQAMAAHLPEGAGPTLDIGCNLGYFCHRLESRGYSPVGVEYLPDIAYAAQKIARSEQKSFRIVTGDIFSEAIQADLGNGEFAVVLAVNVFHHFLKSRSGFKRLEQFMKKLRCQTMFFEPHHPSELQMQSAYKNLTPAEFVGLIAEWGRFQSVAPIYTAADNRTLFVLKQQKTGL